MAYRVRFVVAACELGGRCIQAASRLVRDLCQATAESEPALFRQAMHLALVRRWWGILSCAVQRAYAVSLDERLHCRIGGAVAIYSASLIEETPAGTYVPDVSLLM